MKKILISTGVVFIVVVALISYGIYWAFYDMERLPKGEFLTEEVSPDGKYTVKAYVTNGGTTVSYGVRAELVFNDSKKKPKTIYWNYREDSATITWLNDDTDSINGHELHVPDEKYDFRRE